MNRLAYKLIFKEWSLDLNITRLYVYSQPQKNRRGLLKDQVVLVLNSSTKDVSLEVLSSSTYKRRS